MKELTSEQKILLLETKIESLKKALFILAKAHFGDSKELVDFIEDYEANLIFNYPESCK